MIEITFTGETLLDLAKQADEFASQIIGAELSKNQSKTNATPTGERKKRGSKDKTTVADIARSQPGEEIVPPDAEDEQTVVEEKAPSDKELKEMKEQALDILRSVYVRGEAGQKAVTEATRSFGKRKAADVPVEKAAELLAAAEKLNAEIGEDAPV